MEWEVNKTFGLILEVQDSENDLKRTVESIKNIEYPSNKFIVTISINSNRLHTQIVINEVEHLKTNGINASAVIHMFIEDQYVVDTDTFSTIMNANVDYVCKMQAGCIVEKDLFMTINNENKESIYRDRANNIVILPRELVNNSYLDFLNYNLMVNELIQTTDIIDIPYEKNK